MASETPAAMTEEDYIIATTLARVYAIRELCRHVIPDNRWATHDEIQLVNKMTARWEESLQRYLNKAMGR